MYVLCNDVVKVVCSVCVCVPMSHAHLKPQASTGTGEMVFLASSVFYESIVVVTCLSPFRKEEEEDEEENDDGSGKSINRSFPPVVLRD